jgi:hypothetical protein
MEVSAALSISACSGAFRCFWLLSSHVVQPLSLFSIHSGDKYINGEIIPCTYPTYQPKERRTSKYESRRYERRRDGPPASRKPRQQAPQTESASSWWGRKMHPNLTICSDWCLNLTRCFLYQFCRHLSKYLLKQKSTPNSVTLALWHHIWAGQADPSFISPKCHAVLSKQPGQLVSGSRGCVCWYFELGVTETENPTILRTPSEMCDADWCRCIADSVKCVAFPSVHV